jgi:hypothetical protein
MISIILSIFSLSFSLYANTDLPAIECSNIDNIKGTTVVFSFAYDKIVERNRHYYKKLKEDKITRNEPFYNVSKPDSIDGFRQVEVPSKTEKKFLVTYYGTYDVYLCENQIDFCDENGNKIEIQNYSSISPSEDKNFDYLEVNKIKPLNKTKQDYFEMVALYITRYLTRCTIRLHGAEDISDEDKIFEKGTKGRLAKYSPDFFNKNINKGALTDNSQYPINIEDIAFKKENGVLSVSIDLNVFSAFTNEQMASAKFEAQVDLSTRDPEKEVIKLAVYKNMPALLKQLNDFIGKWEMEGATFKTYFYGVKDAVALANLTARLTQDPSKYESYEFKTIEPNIVLFEFKSKLYKELEFVLFLHAAIGKAGEEMVYLGGMSFYDLSLGL